jgi:general secretion pathway protein F
MTVHLIGSGESSGKLDDMLERAANQQERETTATINVALSLFEPALIVIMGVVVLIIVLAILLPIFELNQLVE